MSIFKKKEIIEEKMVYPNCAICAWSVRVHEHFECSACGYCNCYQAHNTLLCQVLYVKNGAWVKLSEKEQAWKKEFPNDDFAEEIASCHAQIAELIADAELFASTDKKEEV